LYPVAVRPSEWTSFALCKSFSAALANLFSFASRRSSRYSWSAVTTFSTPSAVSTSARTLAVDPAAFARARFADEADADAMVSGSFSWPTHTPPSRPATSRSRLVLTVEPVS
jgi:hypothetical protein